ncbi:MAG TPA: hypothetical protein VFF30_16200 [Nitrososphaerales archaeon]|nr:hypothetical protein [Nitrososphaerales archaeon]
MKAFGRVEMRRLYRFTKATLLVFGGLLIAYGTWFFLGSLLSNPDDGAFWLGILPIYVGSMMIIISLAMKEDWFTNARKYW